ncbi:AtaL-like protein, partial [Streptomyces mirabilis]|uniref:AtaL-like protein n=1 Tax=Streptomyces mirabilis TaxID=68239 RepID=UPI00342D5621
MIEVSRTLSVNDGAEPVLRVDDVWAGLVDKAENPLTYVSSMSECTVTERFDGGLVREVVHVGRVAHDRQQPVQRQRDHGGRAAHR